MADPQPLNTANEIEYLFHLGQKRRELARRFNVDVTARNKALLDLDAQIAVLETRIEQKLELI